MRVLPPATITPSGSFTRASNGTYWDRAGVMQTASNDTPRWDHDPVTGEAAGLILENAMTNLLLNTATLATQGVTVTAQQYVLSFYGTGTVTLSGVHAHAVVGTGASPTRTSYAFTPTAGTLTCTVTGSVTKAQLEASTLGVATSYFPSVGTQGARAADVLGTTFLTNVPIPTSTASTNPDPAAAWSSASVSYVVGSEVYMLSTRRKYISRTIHTSAVGNTPANATEYVPSTDWADNGPMNAYAGIDLLRNTATKYNNEVVYVFKIGRRSDSVGVAGVTAKRVTVKVFRNNAQIYSESSAMTFRNTTTWYEWLHGRFNFKRTFARFNLPPYTDAIIQVIVEYGGSEAVVGAVGIGMSEYIGSVQYGADDDAINFSRINRSVNGAATLVPSRSVPKTIQNIYVDKVKVNRIRSVRESLNAVPAFWSGLDDDTDGYFESLFILGIYKRFSINLRFIDVAITSLELEEI